MLIHKIKLSITVVEVEDAGSICYAHMVLDTVNVTEGEKSLMVLKFPVIGITSMMYSEVEPEESRETEFELGMLVYIP